MRRSRKPVLYIVLTLVFALLFLFFAIKFAEALIDRNQRSSYVPTDPYTAPTNSSVEELGNSTTYNGTKYRINRNITTVLLLGIDNVDYSSDIEIGGGGRSDAIIMLILDNEEQSIKTLSISRDTMVNVDVYNKSGRYVFSGQRRSGRLLSQRARIYISRRISWSSSINSVKLRMRSMGALSSPKETQRWHR